MNFSQRKLLNSLLKYREKNPPLPGTDKEIEPWLKEEFRISVLFDAVKLLATGNGAGAFGAIASMYYFSGSAELHNSLRACAIVFLVGVLLFCVTYLGYIFGLFGAANFNDLTKKLEAKDLPLSEIGKAVTSVALMMLGSISGALSFICFAAGVGIAIRAVVLS
jgi:hypothetical protein